MPVFTIAKRELRSYFDSPLAYVVMCLALVLLGFAFFYLRLSPLVMEPFWKADKANVEALFIWLAPLIGVLVVPVLTMRSMAEEKRSGTLEMLITLPVRDADVVLGKYIGAFTVVLLLIVGSMLYPLAMFGWPYSLGRLDWNTVWAGYLGLVLLASSCVAVGLLVSSLTDSQPIAFFLSFVILGMSFLLGIAAEFGSGGVFEVMNYVSFWSRIKGFAHGLIDVRDIVFFVSITVLCLLVNFWALERRKWA